MEGGSFFWNSNKLFINDPKSSEDPYDVKHGVTHCHVDYKEVLTVCQSDFAGREEVDHGAAEENAEQSYSCECRALRI